jgi:hypothetical protein
VVRDEVKLRSVVFCAVVCRSRVCFLSGEGEVFVVVDVVVVVEAGFAHWLIIQRPVD